MRGLCLRIGVDDEADIDDLKVVVELDATTPMPHEQHLRILTHVR
jgi:hypothetical protein